LRYFLFVMTLHRPFSFFFLFVGSVVVRKRNTQAENFGAHWTPVQSSETRSLLRGHEIPKAKAIK